MNYYGKFDAKVSADALGLHSGEHVHSEHVHTETVHAAHVPSDAIIVSDAHMLFGGEFKRSGVDLVLSDDGRELVLHDYFKGENRAALASPDGAHLTGDLVTALAGQVQYAQADGAASANHVIGHVTKLVGTATAIRNGVSIILNNGDNVEKGDVVASGSDSTLGITFIDGTVFGLSSNARMVLNEMVYDPNGSNNSSLLSLVAGTITFVAGETAKHGDMKVDTPVATMGIRGTAVLVEIDFTIPGQGTPDAKFQVLVEPDGTTGSYILFDKTTLTPLAMVNQAGQQINISNGILSQTLAPLSPEVQKLITDVFALKFSDSSNTKSLDHFTDSIVPNSFQTFKLGLANTNAPTIPVIVDLKVFNTAAPSSNGVTNGHIAEAPTVVTTDSTIGERVGLTASPLADTTTGQIKFADLNAGDQPTASVKFDSFSYQAANGQPVPLGQLNQLQLDDIKAVEVAITVTQDPANKNFGTATWSYSVPDGSFDFLAAGETLTLTYNAIVDNNFLPLDQTTTVPITITITGTNDAPVITSSQQNISFAAAGTDTKGGDLIPDTATSGKLVFTDADLTDTHTVAVKMTSALLDGQPLAATAGQTVINELAAALTAGISKGDDSTGTGAGTIDWTLANLQVYLADLVPAGESLVLTYAVTVTDSQGVTSSQDIVVTIGGNNNAAVVWTDTDPIPAGGALWSTAANWEGDRAPNVNGTDDVFIGTDQFKPATPTFPATVTDKEAAKSLTMDYFTDFGAAIPELDVLSTGALTIVGALNMGTSKDSESPLTAEVIIKNYGNISVGGIATLLKHSVLDNHGTITFAEGGVFGDQSSITNSGTIELGGDTLNVEVDIANSGGTIQVDAGATLGLSDGATISDGKLVFADSSAVTFIGAGGATLKDVTVTGGGEIDVGSAAVTGVTLTLDDGTSVAGGKLVFGDASDSAFIGTGGATLDDVAVTGGGEIDVGSAAVTGVRLALDDATSVAGGKLVFGDASDSAFIGAGGATLDGVAVTGGGKIDVGSAAVTGVTLTLDDATSVAGGKLVFGDASDSAFVGTGGATLDGVAVTGGGEIDVGSATVTGVTLTLDDATSVAGGKLVFGDASDSAFIGAGGATLDGVAVTGGGKIDVGSATVTGVTLTLDDATSVAGGKLVFGDASDNAFIGAGGATLDGVAVTGGGKIDVGSATVTGVALTLDDATSVAGGKLVFGDASDNAFIGAGGATLDGVAVTGGGKIDVGSATVTGVALTLDDATSVAGGKLVFGDASDNAFIGTDGATLDGVAVTGGGKIDVGSAAVTGVTLTLDDATSVAGGKLVFGDASDNAFIGAGGATLDGVAVTGGGKIDVGSAAVTGVTLTLDDATSVAGGKLVFGDASDSAFIGAGGATLDGVAVTGGGKIDVGSAAVTGVTLTLDDATSVAGGKLVFGDASDSAFIGAGGATLDGVAVTGGGKIDVGSATVTGVTLTLDDGTTITSGDLTIAGGSALHVEGKVVGGASATLDGVTVTGTNATLSVAAGTIEVGTTTTTGTVLTLDGGTTITDGNLIVDSGNTLDVAASGATLDGVTLSGSVANAGKLTIDNTVTLNGATINGGTIDDTGTLSFTASSEIDNATINGGGSLTVASGATLTLNNVVLDGVTLSGSVTNSGKLTIDDTVTLNGATITGGTINIVGELDTTGTSFITDAVSIVNLGHIHTLSGTFTIDPTPFTNLGTFEVQGAAVLDDELVTNSMTAAGKTTNGIIQIDPNSTLTLDSSSIAGGIVTNSGTIDVMAGSINSTASSIKNAFSFVNAGTVNADGAELDLVGVKVNNTGGTFKTTGKGVIDLENTSINGGTLSGAIATATGNTSGSTLNGVTLAMSTLVTAVVGVLELTGNISSSGEFDATTGVLDLDNTHITGGTFGGSGTIATVSDFNTLNGVTIAGGTTVKVADGTTLDLVGTITDHGAIALGASGHFTGLAISGNVSLTGGGNVTMTDDTHNFIASDGSAATLTNSDTISGAGTIGDNHLTLVNNGTIDATGTHALIIDTGVNNLFTSTGNLTVTNNGVLEASAGHTLLIDDNVVNNGLIESDSSSAHSSAFVGITGNITGTGSIDIFTNATVEIGGSVSSGQTVNFGASGGPVATNGLLILDDSHDFHGTIAGLTENPVESQENQVDLKDLAYLGPLLTHAHFSHSSDTVTVSNFFDSVTLNVSGNSSGSFEVSSDGHGGTLLDDPAASGTVTVDSNQTLDISAASSATIDFTNTTGTTGALVLDDSKDFSGSIVGFTGDGTTANSDLIDITDINIADVATNKTTYTDHGNDTGTLTLYNANGQALDSINLTGDYQLANFTIENDGNGGTLIVDPPVNGNSQAPSTTTAGSNQVASVAPGENFTFNFSGVTHGTGMDFHSVEDLSQLGHSSLVNGQVAWNGAHDEGHGNMPMAGDSHDSFTSMAILKAHLHAADFHFV